MITTRGLARTFVTQGRRVEAVRGVDIDVGAGELVGFLGPNGAGKTTTLRMLTTLLVPTAGTATVAGHDLLHDQAGVRRNIGYVAQGNAAGMDQRVVDELVVHGRLYGLAARDARRRAAELLDQLDLTGLGDRVVASLSGGQRRRLDVAFGVVHRPKLVFLDEPSTGLDPQSRGNLWQHIRTLRDDGGSTVFLTTHYLDEADELCDRVLVIDGGEIVAGGTPDQLKDRVSGDLVTLRTGGAEAAATIAGSAAGAHEVSVDGDLVSLRVAHGDTALPTLLRDLDRAGISVDSIQTHRPTLDDVFLTLTGRSLRDAETAPVYA